MGNQCDLKLSIFADASHVILSDEGIQLSYLIVPVGNDGKCSLLNWLSKGIKRVDRSTLAAETLILSDAVTEGI